MKIAIDHAIKSSLAHQVEEGIRREIERKGLPDGARLPSIRQIVTDAGVSRNTVIEAYERLVAKGLVRSQQGAGYFVDSKSAGDDAPAGDLNAEEPDLITNEPWHFFSDGNDCAKLGCGWLPEDWRDTEGLAAAVRQVARSGGAALFDYSTPLGCASLRGNLRRRFQQMDIGVPAEQILLTSGASHAIDLLIRSLLVPGDVVFVESPGESNLFGLLRLQGIRIVAIPRTAKGPDIGMLERMLARERPKLFFVNTVFQNPTGSILSPTHAHDILKLAERFNFRVVEDDVYADFQSDMTVRMAALDQLRRVIYVGSFSKSLSCSLRVGFVAGAPDIIRALVDVKMFAGIASSRFAEEVVAILLNSGAYRKSLERLRRRLEGRMSMTTRLLEQAGWTLFTRPSSGMFIWARRPEVADSTALAELAASRGVGLSPGAIFEPEDCESPWVRINVAYATDPRSLAFLENPMSAEAAPYA